MDTLSSLHDSLEEKIENHGQSLNELVTSINGSLEEAKEKIEDTKKSIQDKQLVTFAMPQEQKKVKSLWG